LAGFHNQLIRFKFNLKVIRTQFLIFQINLSENFIVEHTNSSVVWVQTQNSEA